MTKKDLQNGDVIVNRAGYLGVVLKENGYILYQEIGMDDLEDFNDDLTFADEEYRDGDVMEIYRGNSFIDLDDNEPIWQRDVQWHRPTTEEREAREVLLEQERQQKVEEMRKNEADKNGKGRIFVVSQQFYGNRTGTQIPREAVDAFLRGDLDECGIEAVTDVVRRIVRVPGADNLVIVYDQTQEDKYVNEEFLETYARRGVEYLARWGEELKMHVSCEIPEIGFKIHTRCFACRMDENGELQSLEDGDSKKYIRYFPVK